MKKKHRGLVIGGGSIGKRHARNLRSLGEQDLLLVEPGKKAREAFAAELEIPAFASLEEGLEQNPTVAMICSPTRFHLEQAGLCLKQGCALFIEKPLADRWQAVSKFVKMAASARRPVLVGCNFRFHPGLQLLKQLLEEKKLGQLVSIQANFGYYLPSWHPHEDYRKGYSAQARLGGGVALDRIHEFDLVRWLGGDIRKISGYCRNSGSLAIDTEDAVDALCEFSSGAIGTVHVDYLRRNYRCTLDVLGTQGHAQWDFSGASLTWRGEGMKKERTRAWPHWQINDMYVAQARHFLKVLEGRESPAQDVNAAAAILRQVLLLKSKKS
jgi:predicted dehydrogenase